MTNYENIKAMTIDEMAQLLCDQQDYCINCPFKNYCVRREAEGARNWLTMEAET